MRGSLREFQLPDVLQVVGVSRQHTMIELLDERGRQCGAILMKAGQVLAAAHRRDRGKDAFFAMFRETPDAFVVIRKPDRSKYPAPIGSLGQLLFEAIEHSDKAAWDDAVPEEVVETEVDTTPEPATQVIELHAEEPPPLPPAPRTKRSTPTVQRAAEDDARRRHRDASGPVHGAPGDAGDVVIAVASPKGGVGKTTITLNLALSLAERGIDTVVIDADVNGDILSLIDARERTIRGAFDLLDHPEQAAGSLRATVCPTLRILPSCGPEVPIEALSRADFYDRWAALVSHVQRAGDVTLVDCPAGMLHATQAALRAATHVVGVFQAEMIASRSFSMFQRGLELVPEEHRPQLAGVVVNMFQGRVDGSIESFHRVCNEGARHRLFDTTIPRADAFQSASLAGLPLRTSDDASASSIAWLFDMLAEEVCGRLGVARKKRNQVTSFLV